MKLQQDFIDRFEAKTDVDLRVVAAWLEGSFGKGNADRFSDVDAHLLVREADMDAFRQDLKSWLSDVRPLVLFRLLFNNEMANCVTEDGLRVDIWLHAGDSIGRPASRARVVSCKENSLQLDDSEPPGRDDLNATLLRNMQEFWRMIAILPAVLGRGELIVAFMGAAFEAKVLNEVLITGSGILRDTGITKLNPFLPSEDRKEVEAALTLDGLNADALAGAHLRLAAVMSRRGRGIATQRGIEYPAALEESVVRYVSKELRSLGLGDCVREL